MLVPDPTKRIKFHEIHLHSWVRGTDVPFYLQMPFKLDEGRRVLNEVILLLLLLSASILTHDSPRSSNILPWTHRKLNQAGHQKARRPLLRSHLRIAHVRVRRRNICILQNSKSQERRPHLQPLNSYHLQLQLQPLTPHGRRCTKARFIPSHKCTP
jgi:hypothetical protein